MCHQLDQESRPSLSYYSQKWNSGAWTQPTGLNFCYLYLTFFPLSISGSMVEGSSSLLEDGRCVGSIPGPGTDRLSPRSFAGRFSRTQASTKWSRLLTHRATVLLKFTRFKANEKLCQVVKKQSWNNFLTLDSYSFLNISAIKSRNKGARQNDSIQLERQVLVS